MKTCKVKCAYDDEANVWVAVAEKGVGLVLESGNLDELKERVSLALPEMLELNYGYIGEVEIIFEEVPIDEFIE